MAERPILFSGPMVRAILEGRKTQTRRVLSLRGFPEFSEFGRSYTDGFDWCFRDARLSWNEIPHRDLLRRLPYHAGDRLWVREAWQTWAEYDDLKPSEIHPNTDAILYVADRPDMFWDARKRPSIHMPRWSSRIMLEVTDVRVQRLQEISEKDAEEEGSQPILVPPDGGGCPHVEGFRDLWDSLNAERGFGWDQNPWVVAYTFKVLSTKGGA